MKPGPARRLSILLAAIALPGCHPDRPAGATAGSAAPHVGTALAARQILARTIDSAPPALDPSLVTDVPGQHVLDDLFEGLTVITPAGEPGPGVASSWDISADGLEWVFHLRPEARWSNGEPLTAADFLFAWRRTVNPATGSEYAQALAPIRNALQIAAGRLPPEQLGAEAPDAHTLRVHLVAPTPYLVHLMSCAFTFPQHAATVTRWGDDWTRPEHLVGNGAFRLVEQIPGTRLTLERNAAYRDAAGVRIEKVIYYVVADRAAQAQRFMAGQVQFVQTFPTTDAPYLRQRLGAQVAVAPQFGTLKIGINTTRAPFAGNRALRLALNIAVDRDLLVEHVLNGAGFAAWTLVPPLSGYEAQIPDWARLPRAERHALAQRLYREAGYSLRHPLQAELAFSVGDPVTRLVYEAVTAMWRETLGAEISLHPQELRTLIQDRRLHVPQLFHDAWIGDYLDPLTFAQQYISDNELNNGGYANPAYDQLLVAAQAEADPRRRLALFARAEHLLNDDGACIPLYYYADRHLVKPYLKGWRLNSVDHNYSRYMYLLEHDD